MSIWGTIPHRNFLLGICSFGYLSFGKLSLGEMSLGNCPSGKCLSGNCPRIFFTVYAVHTNVSFCSIDCICKECLRKIKFCFVTYFFLLILQFTPISPSNICHQTRFLAITTFGIKKNPKKYLKEIFWIQDSGFLSCFQEDRIIMCMDLSVQLIIKAPDFDFLAFFRRD